MLGKWKEFGTPELFGTNHTIYYHLKLKGWYEMLHDERSSAMNTFIKPDLEFEWCKDHNPYTDLHLFRMLDYKVFRPEKLYSLGIKHGEGLCGAPSHKDHLYRFRNKDDGFLEKTLDSKSYEFYWNYF